MKPCLYDIDVKLSKSLYTQLEIGFLKQKFLLIQILTSKNDKSFFYLTSEVKLMLEY